MSKFSFLYNKEEDIQYFDLLKSFCVAKNKINYLIDNKLCLLNNKIASRETIVTMGDSIEVDTSAFDKIDFPPYEKDIKILYEDDYLLVVEKPAKTIIYNDNKCFSNALDNMVANYYVKTNQQHAVRHVHRLDTDTTGCVLYAKDIFTHGFLNNELEAHRFKKEYLTLVCGKIDNNGQINAKIGKNRHVSGKMIVSAKGQDAYTEFYPVEIHDKFTLCKVFIKTGRTHQIRVHMNYIGHPVVGDNLYGTAIKAERVMLHCFSIGFVHPITRQKIEVKSSMPKDFLEFMKED